MFIQRALPPGRREANEYDRWTVTPPEAGRQFREVRHEAGRDVMSWNLYFSKRVRPATLLWLTPPETRWLTVPFELHDLAMP